MLKSLRSRILLLVTGVVFLTATTISFLAQRGTERAIANEVDQHARDLVKAVLLNVENQYQGLLFYKEAMLERHKAELKNIVTFGINRIEEAYRDYQKGLLSQQEAKAQALSALRLLRYGEGEGYLWINDLGKPLPKVLMHPISPEVEETIPDEPEYYTAMGLGKHLLQAAVDVCLEKGEGYIDYSWAKPTKDGLVLAQPKISYVRLFKEWGWVVGTGIYIDDIDKEEKRRLDAIVSELNRTLASVKMGKTGYMYVFNGQKKLVIHPNITTGADLSELNNPATGKRIVDELIVASKTPGVPFDYVWDKPGYEGDYRFGKRAYVVHFEPLDWYIASSIYLEELVIPGKILRDKIAVISLLCLLVASALSAVLSKGLTRPLQRLTQAAKDIEKGHGEIPVSGTEETRRLGSVLNEMVQSLGKALQEKELTLASLKQSEVKYRTLFERSADSFLIIENNQFIDCNEATVRMLKCGCKEDLLNTHPSELSPERQPDGRFSAEKADEMIAIAFAQGSHRFEWTHKRTDGEEFPVEVLLTAIPQEGRHFLHVVWRDITERKRAEELLQTERFRLSAIISGTNVGTWEWNVQTGETHFNERWAGIIGYSLAELSPLSVETWKKSVHPDDLLKSNHLLKKHFNGEREGYELECRMKHKDGRWVWVVTRGKVATWTESGKPLLMFGTHTDIDERKRLEEERLRIERLNTVGTLAGGIAHDFNNILAGVYGNLSLAKVKIAADQPGYKYLETAEKSMHRASLLTTQLLTFAKGGAPIKENLSLGQLVEEVVHFNLSGSNVKSVITLAEDLWLAEADQGQIQQVFGNLTINAKQAMPDGGYLRFSLENVTLAKNRISGLDAGKYIRITVADEGTGIDPEHIDRIFEPYYTTKQTGSGLGLATIYSIINRHGGHISVASQLGQGTTFTIYLPAAERQGLSSKPPEPTPLIQGHSAKVLVMDDEDVICETITEMLEELNFKVVTASNGQQASELYQEALKAGEPFKLAILDLTIPGGMGGKETAEYILKLDPAARIVISSGYAVDPIMANYSEYGFKGVITKPYNLNKMSAILTRALEA